jgi:hypothetical protein
MLNNAKQILVSELVLVENTTIMGYHILYEKGIDN